MLVASPAGGVGHQAEHQVGRRLPHLLETLTCELSVATTEAPRVRLGLRYQLRPLLGQLVMCRLSHRVRHGVWPRVWHHVTSFQYGDVPRWRSIKVAGGRDIQREVGGV